MRRDFGDLTVRPEYQLPDAPLPMPTQVLEQAHRRSWFGQLRSLWVLLAVRD
jgi:hypothetical protein